MKTKVVLLTAAVAVAAAVVFSWLGWYFAYHLSTAQLKNLEKQLKTTQDELSITKGDLESEKQRYARLLETVKNLGRMINLDPAGKTATLSPLADSTQKPSQDNLKELQLENQRLRSELDRLKQQLKSQIGQIDVQAAPQPPVKFFNPDLLAAWKEVALSTSKTRTLEILDGLSGFAAQEDLELIPILQQAMLGGDVDVCRQAMHMVENYKHPAVLTLLEQGLAHSDGFTRMAALAPLDKINDPQAVELLAKAFNDSLAEIRLRAMEIVANQTDDLQLISLSRAVAASYPDVAKEAVSMLQMRYDKPAVEILISGMNNPDSDVQSEARQALHFLLDREFDTAEQAAKWWKDNHHRYNNDLMER